MKKITFVFLALIALLIAYIIYGLLNGWFWFVEPSLKEFPVRGVDVSHHQGDIDWNMIAQQNIRFAYLKATEGGDHKDTTFQINYRNAKAAGLRVGAYHFFTPNTDGLLQAQNFIDSVTKTDDMLPPVIDVEPKAIGDEKEEAAICARLKVVLETVEKHYGVKPLFILIPMLILFMCSQNLMIIHYGIVRYSKSQIYQMKNNGSYGNIIHKGY